MIKKMLVQRMLLIMKIIRLKVLILIIKLSIIIRVHLITLLQIKKVTMILQRVAIHLHIKEVRKVPQIVHHHQKMNKIKLNQINQINLPIQKNPKNLRIHIKLEIVENYLILRKKLMLKQEECGIHLMME